MNTNQGESVRVSNDIQGEEFYKAFFNLTVAGAVQASVYTGKFLEVNRHFCEMLGYTRAELLEKTVAEVTHPDNRATDAEQFFKLLRGEIPHIVLEKRYRRKDGSFFWANLSVNLLRDTSGVPLRTVSVIVDITASKTAEEKLRESQKRFEALTFASAQIVWTTDADGLVTEDSPTWREFTGQTYEEWKGWGWLTALHPDDRAKAQKVWGAAVAEQTFYEVEYRLRHHGGGYRWTLARGVPLCDETGEICSWVGMNTDIHEQKLSAETLLETQQRLQASIRGANLGIWTYNVGTGDFWADERAKQMHGHTPDEVHTFEEAGAHLHEEDRERAQAAFRQAIETGSKIQSEVRALLPDGEQRWIASYAEFVKKTRTDAGVFCGVVQDVTDRKRSEERLRESEEFSRSVLESSPDCVKILRLDGQIEFMNGNGICLLELDNFDQVKNKCWQNFWKDEDRVQAVETVRRAAAGETMRFQGFCPTAAGKPKWWDVIVTPIRYGSGKIVKLLSVSRDITPLKIVEREREELLRREQAAREEAEAANSSKDEFLAMLSHELRTPLNAMYGWTQLLQTNLHDPKIVQNGIEVIARNVRLQNALIEDLLDVSRIITGKLGLETEEINLLPTVREAVEAAQPAAEKKNIRLETDFDLPADKARGDRFRIQQIVNNLLANAVKFTPNGGKIEISLRGENGFARLEIRDNGVGIEPELLPHIFDRFRQADGSMKRQFGGLGLGLTIAKHLVELHEGTITAASDGAGKGTVFTVELPLASFPREIKTIADDENVPSKAVEKSAKLADLKILLVDDDVDSVELIGFALEKYGAATIRANSVAEALLLLERENFDLLISDLGMAGMDGFDLIESVRKADAARLRPLPAVALTGYASADDRERVLKAGFNLYFSKPIDIEQLPANILTLLEAHK